MNSKKLVASGDTQPAQDLAYGQGVVVIARWILVLTGLVLMLWLPSPIEQLRFQILFILLLAMANFYLNAQLLMKRPAVEMVAYLASAGDIALITILIILSGGYKSDLYIFYFPALLAISVAFDTRITSIFGVVVIVMYAVICFLSGLAARDFTEAAAQVLLTRLLMLAAVVFSGNLYWRIERSRRQAAEDTQEQLTTHISSGTTAE